MIQNRNAEDQGFLLCRSKDRTEKGVVVEKSESVVQNLRKTSPESVEKATSVPGVRIAFDSIRKDNKITVDE